MAIFYVIDCLIIILFNLDELPLAIQSIFHEAFSKSSVAGGMIGTMIIGFQRAVFSNEAGLGSSAIAHSAVKTNQPITEGYVALLEPLIDTIIICTMTSLVILVTVYDPSLSASNIEGVVLTSKAFDSTIPGSSLPLSFIAILFAFSTMLAWSYYGMKGWTYLFGNSPFIENIFKVIFCIFIVLGCMINLDSVLKISDAIIFIVAIPNIIGLYLLAPLVKKELKEYNKQIGDIS
jgi:AGCS family alanine or glycine:cation symporter